MRLLRVVVADTGPLNYLVLIGESDILPKLFEAVFVPEAVRTELRHRDAPPTVRAWAERPPAWLDIRPVPVDADDNPTLRALDDGERAALVLARALSADLLLMDDRAAVAAAHAQGFAVTGTLGILELAARRGLIDLGAAFTRLKATNFRCRPEIMDALLAQRPAQKT
jgi:predicted nucleic acid-binding protein